MTQEKNNFIFGISVGVEAVSLIGFLMMSVAYLSKNNQGAKLADSNPAAQNNNANNDNVKNAPTPSPKAGVKANIAVSDKDNIRGNKNAKITIVEFSDIQCPFCTRFHNTMKQVMAAYPNDVRWVFKHFPLESIHPVARKSAEASECAAEQGKFWEYTDYLFDNQKSLSNEFISSAAKEVGLDTGKFDSCLSSGKYASKVSADASLGQQNGVSGTPTSFINGELLSGAQAFEAIKTKIESIK